ncbi:MerR family transcriptional regulator [Shouchella patagoniensis]|uniref:MerR family transcriptional regulator n=1 Tax=Shouchella patagoniensis TaxID=228576 RepID=UPI0014729C1D|nr:MerR family transcriptional regulator [Shouchella patagoniensis]
MKISELATETGVSIRSIRYYEQKNLIRPQRLDNGYRLFEKTDINRVKAIQLFLDLGLNTEEIEPIIHCGSLQPVDGSVECSATALTLYEEKLQQTQQQIKQLKQSESHLIELISFWKKVHAKQKNEEEQ